MYDFATLERQQLFHLPQMGQHSIQLTNMYNGLHSVKDCMGVIDAILSNFIQFTFTLRELEVSSITSFSLQIPNFLLPLTPLPNPLPSPLPPYPSPSPSPLLLSLPVLFTLGVQLGTYFLLVEAVAVCTVLNVSREFFVMLCIFGCAISDNCDVCLVIQVATSDSLAASWSFRWTER